MTHLNRKSVSFILWLAFIFGFAGIHRFYLGKPFTGFLYLITWGFLGIGQVIDLFRLSGMVEDRNLIEAGRRWQNQNSTLAHVDQSDETLRKNIIRFAEKYGGAVSVTQVVKETGLPFQKIEETLNQMLSDGYVGIGNDEETGAVVYRFYQLS